MKEEVENKIMAARKNILVHQKQSESLLLTVSYQPLIFTLENLLTATITITPKRNLVNSPLQIQLRGFSNLQTVDIPNQKATRNLETTQVLMQNEDKMQSNTLLSQYKSSKTANTKHQEQSLITEEQGEYFLEGCHVLYQLDDQSKTRLELLQQGKQYRYPVQFILPQSLPESVSDILLQNILITIRYTLEVKFSSIDESSQREDVALVLPFQVSSPPKVYPYEELALQQKIRCYHSKGKIEDKRISSLLTKSLKCLCPNLVFQRYLRSNKIIKTKYSNYDLLHLELLAVIYQDLSLHLTVRTYKDPEVQSLTQHREKQESRPQIKPMPSLTQIPNQNDVSQISMKDTTRKNEGLNVQKVEVELIADLQNICTQSILKKVILLNQSNLDMIQGQTIVKLAQFLNCPKSFRNELFTLSYRLKVKAEFGQGQEGGCDYFQDFVTQQVCNELIL